MNGLAITTNLILRCNVDAVGIASKEAPENAGNTLVRASRLACGEHLSMREFRCAPCADPRQSARTFYA